MGLAVMAFTGLFPSMSFLAAEVPTRSVHVYPPMQLGHFGHQIALVGLIQVEVSSNQLFCWVIFHHVLSHKEH